MKLRRRKRKIMSSYGIMSSVFVFICLIFVARLVNLQFNFAKTAELRSENGFTYENEVIQALRGNICDRNGRVIVTSSYSYDIIFDYDSMPDDKLEFNRSILTVLDAIAKTHNASKRVADLYPLVGTYPNLSYSDEAMAEGSPVNLTLQRILSDLKKEGVSANELVDYFVDRWGYLDKNEYGNRIYSDEEITNLLRVRYDMLRTQFSPTSPYYIAKEVGIEFVSYIKELGITGVSDRISTNRTYLYPGYASHILGRVGSITAETWDYYKELGYNMSDKVGIDGCEAAFEEYLRGKDGVRTIKRNSKGDIVDEYISVEPIAGKDVYLTIDLDAQIAADDALEEYMKYFEKERGSSVAVNPQNGEILAIASYPTFDLTTFSKDYSSLANDENLPLLNRSIYAAYAPGSTFKIAVALAGLQENAITSSSKILCNGGYMSHGMNIKCNNHPTYHTNYLNLNEALTFSCNAFFIGTGYDRLNIDKMTEYCTQLGLGQSTGIELPELAGQIACPDNSLNWTAYEEASSYIGQSIHKYTPLQLSSYIATVANGGTRYAAHLLHSVRTFSGEVVVEYEPNVLSTVDISSGNLGVIKEGLRSMVNNSGTAVYNFYTTYKIKSTVCGKSGTAQVGKSQNCWFTAFAPMNNPEIVVTSIIENGGSGASVSMIDAAVMAAYLNK